MHRIDAEDYKEPSPGYRLFKETPVPATVVGAGIMNAVQEELATIITSARSGLTLRTSSTLDEASGWNQLNKAVENIIKSYFPPAVVFTTMDIKDEFGTIISGGASVIGRLLTDINNKLITLTLAALFPVPTASKYLYFDLPTGWIPWGHAVNDVVTKRVMVTEINTMTQAVIEHPDRFCCSINNDGTGRVYIGNHELAHKLPTVVTFPARTGQNTYKLSISYSFSGYKG